MDKKRNWRVFLPYLLLPVVLILALSFFTTTQNRVKTEYYQIVQYFDQGEVTAYRFNLSSRVLEYQLKGSNEWQKYTVPNANLFVEDIHESVREYNKAHPNAPIKYDMEAIARQPEASGDIRMNMIIAAALIEGVALLAVVVCLLVFFL